MLEVCGGYTPSAPPPILWTTRGGCDIPLIPDRFFDPDFGTPRVPGTGPY